MKWLKQKFSKLKTHLSEVESIKHDVATRMHFQGYKDLRSYRGQDKAFVNRWIRIRIMHYVKTGEFDNCKKVAKKLFKNGGTEVEFLYATTR